MKKDKILARTPKSQYFRINLTLPEALDRFLEEVGMEARAPKGYKLPKTMIVRALVRMMGEMDVDVSGIKTEEELIERLHQAALGMRR
ncbi:MAG: hypothetical protein HZB91_00890 [Elusimicrobia bacterium]|nr:hypothetical protein [Elusimicrobiota bacterium]